MIHLRIPQKIYQSMLYDLNRPHKFALERVGFLFINKGELNDGMILVATEYMTVDDNDYIEDLYVGAKINSSAIRKVMQKILDTGHGALHVHLHEDFYPPAFSKIDKSNIVKLIPSFRNINPSTVNGALIIQNDKFVSMIWAPEEVIETKIDQLTIVGYPMGFYGRKYE